jgi:putative tricarboxylic transport membrane protein
VLGDLLAAFQTALTPTGVTFLVLGTAAGILLGAMPGLGPTTGMAVALPFVIRTEPEYAIFLFTAIIIGAMFGNGLPAVLVGVPGTPSALLTVEFGAPFQAQGQGGRALLISLFGAAIGQVSGVLAFTFLIGPVAAFSVNFLFPEFFALELLGLTAAAALVGRSRLKGAAAVLIGLLLVMVGPDPVTGQDRLTFGVDELSAGVEVVPALIGLLALREAFLMAADARRHRTGKRHPVRFPRPRAADLRQTTGPAALGSGVGVVVGALPGAGPVAASFITYRLLTAFRRWRTAPGEGSLPAVASTDASQNASSTAALIPTLALGIPGEAAMVVVLAALTSQGVVAGPHLDQTRPGLLATVSAGLLLATLLMVVLGYLAIWPSAFLASAPPRFITYATLVAVVVGVYAYRQTMVDVWVCLAAGLLGFAMAKVDIPVAPAALALVLGHAAESDLRRGLILTDGVTGFVSRPATAIILAICLALLLARPAGAAVSKWTARRTA